MIGFLLNFIRFKYVVTCIMQQINGAGMASVGAVYSEPGDGAISKSIEINDLFFCINVFAVLI